MTTAFVSVFLFMHGLVHLPVWLAPTGTSEPFDPRHSWALAAAGLPRLRDGRAPGHGSPPARAEPRAGERPRLGEGTAAIALASATAVLYVIAGAAASVQSNGWTTAAVTAACVGLVLKALWFNP